MNRIQMGKRGVHEGKLDRVFCLIYVKYLIMNVLYFNKINLITKYEKKYKHWNDYGRC